MFSNLSPGVVIGFVISYRASSGCARFPSFLSRVSHISKDIIVTGRAGRAGRM